MAELWMNMPSKTSQVHIVWFYLYEVSKIEKLIKTENINIIEVTRCRDRVGEMEYYCLMDIQFLFGLTKNFWKLRVMMIIHNCECPSVQFSCSVVSNSLWPHEPQHTGPPCPSPNPRNLPKFMSIESVMPSNHLILYRPFLLPPSIFPSIKVFSNESALRIKWPKYWGFSSASVLPMNTQDWSPLGWTSWISLQSKRLSGVLSNTTVQKHQFFGSQLSL